MKAPFDCGFVADSMQAALGVAGGLLIADAIAGAHRGARAVTAHDTHRPPGLMLHQQPTRPEKGLSERQMAATTPAEAKGKQDLLRTSSSWRFSLPCPGKDTAHMAFRDAQLTGNGASGFLGIGSSSGDDLALG